jgi:protein SCO1/2
MTRYWSLILVATFIIGFAAKSYLNTQYSSIVDDKSTKQDNKNEQGLSSQDLTQLLLYGQNNLAVKLFDPQDTRIRIIYFGFTHCPDVCPTSLAMLSGALNKVNDHNRSQLRAVFITLDPERDDPEASFNYAQYFHPMIEGFSAPLPVLTTLTKNYGVVFQKQSLKGSTLEYTLDHNSYFYFIKPDGTLITKVPHTFSPEPLVTAINDILTNKKFMRLTSK